MRHTIFNDVWARTQTRRDLPFDEICRAIETAPPAPAKESLSWIKLASFGEKIENPATGCLRTNFNMTSLSGVEIDHDAETLTIEEAGELLRALDIDAFLYTSPSADERGLRWRALLPLAEPVTGDIKAAHGLQTRRANGVLRGAASGESFTLSQAYYFGPVEGRPFRCIRVTGRHIDTIPDLAEIGRGAQGAASSLGYKNIESALEACEAGDDMHGASLYLTMRGVDRADIVAAIEASDRDSRDKQRRIADLDRMLRGAMRLKLQAFDTVPRDEERRAAQIADTKRIGAADTAARLPTVMTLDDMTRDLVFVGEHGAVVHKPTMRVRRRDAAGGEYAASEHVIEDEATGKMKRVPALPLWRKSPGRVTVDCITWAPDKPEFCDPPEGGGRAINTWRGFQPMPAPDDWAERVKPFLDHVEYLVPVQTERQRFVEWVAHIVQAPGQLPHTCYLFVTPERGIGRNWLTGVLARVLRGYVAAGVALGDVLDGGFNGRLSGKLLATVDETREGQTAKRYERANALQRVITEDYRHINEKYGAQRVEYNCCRWLMLSNFPDALPFDNKDRRVIVIQNPVERRDADYYARMYALQNDAPFLASVRRYLETVDLAGFNPGMHAPMNAAKLKSLEAVEPEMDRVVREFATAWPGAVCGRSDVRRYVQECMGADYHIGDAHLSHALDRAGILRTGVRLVLGVGNRDRVLIVRDATPEQVEAFAVTPDGPALLRDAIREAAAGFRERT